MIIQAFISGPRFMSFRYSTDGASYTAATIAAGYYSFKSYLAKIEAELPNSWGCEYDEAADRVQFTRGSGSLYIILDNQSQADLLGFSALATRQAVCAGCKCNACVVIVYVAIYLYFEVWKAKKP